MPPTKPALLSPLTRPAMIGPPILMRDSVPRRRSSESEKEEKRWKTAERYSRIDPILDVFPQGFPLNSNFCFAYCLTSWQLPALCLNLPYHALRHPTQETHWKMDASFPASGRAPPKLRAAPAPFSQDGPPPWKTRGDVVRRITARPFEFDDAQTRPVFAEQVRCHVLNVGRCDHRNRMVEQARCAQTLLEIPAGTPVTYSEKAPALAGALHFLRQQSRPSLSSSSNTPAP